MAYLKIPLAGKGETHQSKSPIFWVPAVCGFESVVSSGKKGQNQTRIIHKAKLHSPKQPSLMEDKVLANLNKSSASHTCVRKNNGE